VHGPYRNPLTATLDGAGLTLRSDGPWGIDMAIHVEGRGWASATEDSSKTAARADWDTEEAADGSGQDRHDRGVDWYLADRRLRGPAANLASSVGGALGSPRMTSTWPEAIMKQPVAISPSRTMNSPR